MNTCNVCNWFNQTIYNKDAKQCNREGKKGVKGRSDCKIHPVDEAC